MRLINFKNTLVSRDYCTRFLRPRQLLEVHSQKILFPYSRSCKQIVGEFLPDRAAPNFLHFRVYFWVFKVLAYTSLCFPARPGNYIKCSLSKGCDYRLARRPSKHFTATFSCSNSSGPPVTWFQNQRRRLCQISGVIQRWNLCVITKQWTNPNTKP